MNSVLNTPVLFLIFNRLDLSKKVFQEIKKVQPRQLYIAADGGRNEEEHILCRELRESILSMVDWECEVYTNFREENAGCGKNVSEAITWFFEHVEEGIILEDDCLPSKNFFYFCEENLSKHRENQFIFSINGTCLEEEVKSPDKTYKLTKYPLIWGWATWKRAWNNYQFEISSNNEQILSSINKLFKTDEVSFWKNILILLEQKKIDTWDYQWCFTVWQNNGRSIQPNKNMISNIGFDSQATHTKSDSLGLANRKISNIAIDLIHPKTLVEDPVKDRLLFTKYFNPIPVKKKLKRSAHLIKKIKGYLVNRLVNSLSPYFEFKINTKIDNQHNPHHINLSENAFIESILQIENGKQITLQEGSSIGKLAWVAAIESYGYQHFERPTIVIGRNTRIGNFSCITAIKRIEIGNGVLISDYFYTSDHSHDAHPTLGSPVMQGLSMKGEVKIGDNCFIGMRVSILPGVTLGEHCIVGANSVVTKSFPPYTMIAGIPAKAIKKYNFEANKWEILEKNV